MGKLPFIEKNKRVLATQPTQSSENSPANSINSIFADRHFIWETAPVPALFSAQERWELDRTVEQDGHHGNQRVLKRFR